MSGTGNRRGRNVRWWLALLAWSGWACGLSGAVSVPDRDREAVVPAWSSDFEAAMGRARVSLRPVLVLFTGDNCPACFRLKQGPLTDESVFEVLRQFERVEVDIGRRSELALQYQVRGIPAFRVFEPDGRLRGGFEGYRSAGPLVAVLEEILAPAQPTEDPTLLLQRIREGSVEPDDWVATLRLFAVPAARSEVRSAVFSAPADTRRLVVDCLSDARLAVRLGALDLLEELTGDPMGYDPWTGPLSEGTDEARERWKTWSTGTNLSTTLYATLTEERFERYLQDLVGDHPERSRRAVQVLAQGGTTVLHGFSKYLETHPDLDDAAQRRIREVQYALTIPPGQGLDPVATAHRLVWGNLDVQMQTIAQLADCGTTIMPILIDLLKHPDPLVREVTADTAFAAADRYAVKPMQEHLDRETDTDVLHTILLRLGKIKTRRSADILERYFTHADEDLAIVAIQGGAAVSPGTVIPKLPPLLKDSRWRVRVAALQALNDRESRSRVGAEIVDAVVACLEDPDEFVRHTAVTTLVKLNVSDARNRLNALYRKHPDMRGIIAVAMLAFDHALPPAMEKELFEGEPADLLMVLDNLAEPSNVWPLVLRASRHPHADVACTALRIIARTEKRTPEVMVTLIDALLGGVPERQLTVMEELDVEYRQIDRLRQWVRQTRNTGDPAVPASGDGQLVNDLLRAFQPAGPASRAVIDRKNPTEQDVLKAIEQVMDDPATRDNVRRMAMLFLSHYGHTAAFRRAESQWGSLTPSERALLTANVQWFGDEGAGVFGKAIRDESALVVERALEVMDEIKSDQAIEAFTVSLLAPGSLLTPRVAWPAGLRSLCSSRPDRALKMGRNLSDTPGLSDDLAILSLTLLAAGQPQAQDVRRVEPGLAHANPFVRRAAWLALFMVDTRQGLSRIRAIQEDPSPAVRGVLAACLASGSNRERRYDVYFDEQVYFTGYDSLRIQQQKAVMLTDSLQATLSELAEKDPDPWVRFCSALTLLGHQVPVDLRRVLATGRACNRRSDVARALSAFFESHSETLGSSFSVLLPLLKTREGDSYDSYAAKRLVEKWGTGEVSDEAMPFDFQFTRSADAGPTLAQFTDRSRSEWKARSIHLVFFTTPGCRECSVVRGWIEQIQSSEPELQVQAHNIRSINGMRNNEWICSRFEVPDRLRGVTPAVFMESGYLIHDALSRDALRELVQEAKAEPGETDWFMADETTLAGVDETLKERARSYTLPLVLGGGLIDGVNPCAFATMVFLVSYLRVRRRTRREILAIGTAYVLGVFGTYLALGLGMSRLLEQVTMLEPVSRFINGVMALGMLVLAMLSVRDGFRCLQGRAGEMTLQLPDRLKQGIHGMIREGTRYRQYVPAALVLGVVVALLELACTSQVYAPTIIYLIQSGTERIHAMTLLVCYNLAFVLPLIMVFGVTAWGTGSDRIQAFMMRHLALAKFAMAAVFIVLLAAFIKIGF